MWEKEGPCRAAGRARPLRVAYLVDIRDSPHELFDSIFEEAYGRWGGRRTVIVPSTQDGIDERYSRWLHFYDADVIYSFVQLSTDAVQSIHERYAPTRLVGHEEGLLRDNEKPRYNIRLPISGLKSLSVVPAFLASRLRFDSRREKLQILEKFWDRTESKFLRENFGFLWNSVAPAAGSSFPELFSPLTLISQASLDNSHLLKVPGDYRTEESDLLDALADMRPLLTVSNLSEMFAPYLAGMTNRAFDGMRIVVGDSIEDRLSYWNGHHRYERTQPYEVTGLHLSTEMLADDEFLGRVRRIIARRNPYSSSNQNNVVVMQSCSLSPGELEAAAERLRKIGVWLAVRVECLTDAAAAMPIFGRDEPYFSNGSFQQEPEGRGALDFEGTRVPVPKALPWHLSETPVPPGLRGGSWSTDISIERRVDHSRYSNVRHVWAFPRRIRIERTFNVTSDKNSSHPVEVRPLRGGELGIVTSLDQGTLWLSTPEDDLSVFRVGLTNIFEWQPFQSGSRAATGRKRFYDAELSDKGRYLLGVLQLFEAVPSSLNFLAHNYWRAALPKFGAAPPEKMPETVNKLVTTLSKRLNQKGGELHFTTPDQIERLGFEALRVASELRADIRFRDYGELRADKDALVQSYLKRTDDKFENEEEKGRFASDLAAELDHSIQALCLNEVLFQGRHWQCQTCFNRNWVGIGELDRLMTCEVCGNQTAADVSGDWHFRANPFVVDAYRNHGTEPVLLALNLLLQRSKRSFYFAPSTKLWASRDSATPTVEVDLLAVVDGKLVAVEATSSAGLKPYETERLAFATDLIRPDLLLVLCSPEKDDYLETLASTLRKKVASGVDVEVLRVPPIEDDWIPFFPI